MAQDTPLSIQQYILGISSPHGRGPQMNQDQLLIFN